MLQFPLSLSSWSRFLCENVHPVMDDRYILIAIGFFVINLGRRCWTQVSEQRYFTWTNFGLLRSYWAYKTTKPSKRVLYGIFSTWCPTDRIVGSVKTCSTWKLWFVLKLSLWIRQRLGRKGKLENIMYINTNYSFCKSKWHPIILTKKPVSPFEITTSPDVPPLHLIWVSEIKRRKTWADKVITEKVMEGCLYHHGLLALSDKNETNYFM